jgi:hypothetical protein
LVNTIYGDGGEDTAIFYGPRSRYTIDAATDDGSEMIVTPRGPAASTQATTLYDVELLRIMSHTYSASRLAARE